MGASARWLVGIVAAVGALGAQELTKLTPELAGQAVGREATVCGVVMGFVCSPGEHTAIVFRTDLGAPRFDVAIAPADRGLFETPLEGHYFGQRVCATGTVRAASRGYRIWASAPGQLWIDGARQAEAATIVAGVYWACDGSVRIPRIVREVKPQYTAKAMRAGVQGTIELQGIVDVDGSVRHAEVIRPLDPGGLDEEAVTAVKQWQFKPGTRDGVAVPVAVSIELTFVLAKKK